MPDYIQADMFSVKQIKDLCKAIGLRPVKNKGQNFLINKAVLDDILAAACIGKEDSVVEVGPGLGVLTQSLVERAKKVLAIELDARLYNYLKDRFSGQGNLDLIQADVISLLKDNPNGFLPQGKYKLVANLPYQITSHFLRLILQFNPKPIRAVLMVQLEVGQRICARVGKMSMLSVMAQYYGRIEIIKTVGRQSFWPVPEVDSAILKIDLKPMQGLLPAEQEVNFFRLVKIGFSSRRKKLINNLAGVFGKKAVLECLKQLGIDLNIRAQELSVSDWVQLSLELDKHN